MQSLLIFTNGPANFLRPAYIKGIIGDGMFKVDLAVKNANLGFVEDINER